MSKQKKKKKSNIKALTNPHDLLVKASLSNPGAIHEFAKAYFPPEMFKRIDSHSLKLTNKSYVSDELKEFHNDLVFSFTIENQPGYGFFLLEHQSTPDFRMPLRFVQYNLALLEEHLKGKDQTERWPIIFNVCLYHNPDEKPYPYPTNVYDQFVDPYLAEKLGIFTKFHLVDLNTISDKTLEEHTSIRLMEKLLKYSRHRDVMNVLIKELKESDVEILIHEDYWKTILVYSLHVIGKRGNSEQKIVSLFKEVLSKNEEEIMTTIAQTIEKRGEKRGIAKGMQQGMQQGIEKVAYDLLLKLNLDRKTVQKATGLTEEDLQRILKK